MTRLRLSRRTLLPSLLLAAVLGVAPAQASTNKGPAQNKRLTSSKDYVQLNTITAPIAARYRFNGILVVDVGLDVPDPKLHALAELSKPRLQDTLRAALSDYTHALYRPGQLPDPERMLAMMQMAVNKSLGAPGARVLFVSIMVQPGQ